MTKIWLKLQLHFSQKTTTKTKLKSAVKINTGGKEQTPSVTEWRKNLGRNQAQSADQFSTGPDKPTVCSNCSKVRL